MMFLKRLFCKHNYQQTKQYLEDYNSFDFECYTTRTYLVKEYKCSKCGCDGHWQDGIIKLEVHHKDGDNHNNELSNLMILCPLCHKKLTTHKYYIKNGQILHI